MFSHYLHSGTKVGLSVVLASTLVLALPLLAIGQEGEALLPPSQAETTVTETPPAPPPAETTSTEAPPTTENSSTEIPPETTPQESTVSEAGPTESAEQSNTQPTTPTEGQGENGGAAGESSETPSVIETGDAVAEGNVATSGNTNQENVGGGKVDDVNVTNANAATSTTEATVEAETGENTAVGGGGAVIDTGNALASANVINVINTNIFNSNGLLLFLSGLFGSGFDLRNFDFGWGSGTSTCSLTSCASGADLNISNTNSVYITNTLIVRSSTGGNTASSTGDGYIDTGNAYASGNLINVANTNITNSNYLLIGLNNFGSLNGDIVLPSKDFFSQFFKQGGGTGGNTTLTNNNTAEVNNNVSVGADTGGNSAEGNGAVVVTGDANASATVVNQVNTNLFDVDSVFILIRIHGNWAGDIFGLPDGISWAQTPFGIQLFSTPEEGTGGGDFSKLTVSGNTGITNTNSAVINNNVSVYALTGDNKVKSGEGGAMIETGNAYASANVVNIANTNVVGKNWILAIFNIFGDWNGNLSFGQPDLWIGARSESMEATVTPGSKIKFYFTVTNFGDAEATEVKIKNKFDRSLIDLYDRGERGDTFSVGSVKPGQTVEVEYEGVVKDGLPFGNTPLLATTKVTARESEGNMENNTEELSLLLMHLNANHAKGAIVSYTNDPKLSVEKTHAGADSIQPGSTVDYTIKVKNDGGEAYHSTLFDVIKNRRGRVIAEEQWDLGVILPGEEITVTYTAEFGTSTPLGVYNNEAYVEAIGRHPSTNPFYGVFADSNVASTTITVYRPLAYEFSIPTFSTADDVSGTDDAGEEAIAGASVERVLKEIKSSIPTPSLDSIFPPTGGIPDTTLTPPGYGREIQSVAGGFLPKPTKVDLYFISFLVFLAALNAVVSGRKEGLRATLSEWKNRFASF